MTHVTGLLPICKTWIEFPAPDFSPHPVQVEGMGEIKQQMGVFSHYLVNGNAKSQKLPRLKLLQKKSFLNSHRVQVSGAEFFPCSQQGGESDRMRNTETKLLKKN